MDTTHAQQTWHHGTVWTLRHRSFEATIGQAGATLLGLRHGEEWLSEPTSLERSPAAGNGQLLVPWPNRIRDGRWPLAGVTQQLPLTEPARGNASHGLLRAAEYHPVEVCQAQVRLRARVFPVTGYPFRLDHVVTYRLGEDGLSVHHDLTHRGAPDAPAAPAAIGAHPYLRVGDVDVAQCSLQVNASTRLVVDEQLIPVGAVPVSGDDDWRQPRRIGPARPDTCWRDLRVEEDQVVRHRLRAPDGRGVDLWADPVFGHVQVFVTDRLPGRELAIAIEPMTAAPDAFNSGDGLAWLAPGETLSGAWGISPVGGAGRTTS